LNEFEWMLERERQRTGAAAPVHNEKCHPMQIGWHRQASKADGYAIISFAAS
jgi:hypothetical protein